MRLRPSSCCAACSAASARRAEMLSNAADVVQARVAATLDDASKLGDKLKDALDGAAKLAEGGGLDGLQDEPSRPCSFHSTKGRCGKRAEFDTQFVD